MKKRILGVIGGSGIYDLPYLKEQSWVEVETPWGKPSDKILQANYKDQKILFLPRHGRNHTLGPSAVNYRANIYALKSLGTTEILSFSACGSFKEEYKPGSFILIDQYIDNTRIRDRSFFDEKLIAHIPFSQPSCKRLEKSLVSSFKNIDIEVKRGGTYLAIEGPQFSTYAESNLFKNIWGCDVIGMTNMPEAKLAREAEICYQTIAMVTDYDCWNKNAKEVSVEDIKKIFQSNSTTMQKVLTEYIEKPGENEAECSQGCTKALENAFVTPKEFWTDKDLSKLNILLSKYI